MPTTPQPSDGASMPEASIARALEEGLNPQRKLIAELMHSQALARGDFAPAIRQVTETAARLLRCERVSVWRRCGTSGIDARIECVDLFERGPARHSQGSVIHEKYAPRYFAAIAEERTLTAHDARIDPRTSEFTTAYLEPLGITAMLDAPVFVRGELVAIVCHEHVGEPRRWQFWEELVAGTSSDFVALLLEAEGWHAAERALREERDALERKVAERTAALRASEESLRTLLAVTPVALVVARIADHSVLFANPRAFALFDFPSDTPMGLNATQLWVDDAEHRHFVASASSGRVDGMEVRLRTRSGHTFWARLSAQPMQYGGEETLLATIDDITAQKQAEARLRELATRDVLTGIHNRRSLIELGQSELDRARRYSRPFAAAMIDIDHFKRVNDERGHAAGDEVLRAVVNSTSDALRGSDLFGRWGGEEFVVLLPETDLGAAHRVLERVRAAVAATPFAVGDGPPVSVSISIGVAEWTGIEALETLVQRADQALYTAKHQGRNRVELAPPA